MDGVSIEEKKHRTAGECIKEEDSEGKIENIKYFVGKHLLA